MSGAGRSVAIPGNSGADALARTLIANDVTVCFTNPGTSEMHFVGALDRVRGLRCILGLFEGVVTGAADGYARIADKPAVTLLHLAPGLANGAANLHNARKAHSPIVNIVGEHATYHRELESPLAGDVAGVARPFSHWIHMPNAGDDIARAGAMAIAEARRRPGRIATLILPADLSWSEGGPVAMSPPVPLQSRPDQHAIRLAAAALRCGRRSMLMLGGRATRGEVLTLAGRIAAKTDCRLLTESNNPVLQRGAGRTPLQRLPSTPVEAAQSTLADVDDLVLAGAKPPVAFFAYPGRPSFLTPEGCRSLVVASPEDDVEHALRALAEELDADGCEPIAASYDPPDIPRGAFSYDGIGAVIGALLPENAIVVDESVTTGRRFPVHTANAAPHDWLNSMGGSIGFALPNALGAAVAAPDRKVIALEGDGSGMYTLQALWSMAREGSDVTILVFANRTYEILIGEFQRMGSGDIGPRARDMLEISRPTIDWLALAKGHGVEAGEANDLEELAVQFRRGLACKGPYLIQVNL